MNIITRLSRYSVSENEQAIDLHDYRLWDQTRTTHPVYAIILACTMYAGLYSTKPFPVTILIHMQWYRK